MQSHVSGHGTTGRSACQARSRVAKCSRCRCCRPVTSHSMTGSVRLPAFIRHALVPNPCGAAFGCANRQSCRFVPVRRRGGASGSTPAARAAVSLRLTRTPECCARQEAESDHQPAISKKRLSLTLNGIVRYDLKGFTSVVSAERMDAQERPSRRHLAAMAGRASSHSGPPALRPSAHPSADQDRCRRSCRAARFHRPPIGQGAETASQRHSCVRDYLSKESNATPWHLSRVCTSASRSLGRQPNSPAFVRSVCAP